MPTLVFIGFSNITGIQILVPEGKEKFLLISIAAGALLNLILNAIWIPYWSNWCRYFYNCGALVLGIQVWF
ncbi:MAG: polysaccharide biosynthesis C-terminal domain-containing protein [Acutalibacteraceae bacterium]